MRNEGKAKKIVDRMYNNDPFSQWLGIQVIETGEGHSVLEMTIRKEMLNGFNIAHGGISYSLADSALAFAANGYGRMSMSIETSISHTSQVKEGDVLKAVAEELSLNHKIGIYQISITQQDGELVALFKGTVYRTSKDWDIES